MYEPQRPLISYPLRHFANRPHIYILALDSTSRSTMRRFAPRSFRTLQKLGFTWFHRFNTVSPGGTRSTLFPLMHGGICLNQSNPLCGQQQKHPRHLHWEDIALKCTSPTRRLMSRLKRRFGYRTGLAELAAARQYMVLKELDNRLPWFPFYKFNRSNSKPGSLPVQYDLRCVGDELAYLHVLDFAADFFQQQPGPPGFLYAHLSGAHDSPRGLQFIDEGLAKHLRVMAEEPNLVMMVLGDHGRQEHNCDYQRPMLAMKVAPEIRDFRDDLDDVLTRIPGFILEGFWRSFLEHIIPGPCLLEYDGVFATFILVTVFKYIYIYIYVLFNFQLLRLSCQGMLISWLHLGTSMQPGWISFSHRLRHLNPPKQPFCWTKTQ